MRRLNKSLGTYEPQSDLWCRIPVRLTINQLKGRNRLMQEEESPGRESLTYHPSKVSWATAEFIQLPPDVVEKLFLYCVTLLIVISIIYCHFSIVAISIESRGSVITEQSIIPIRAPGSWKIQKLYVHEYQNIKR